MLKFLPLVCLTFLLLKVESAPNFKREGMLQYLFGCYQLILLLRTLLHLIFSASQSFMNIPFFKDVIMRRLVFLRVLCLVPLTNRHIGEIRQHFSYYSSFSIFTDSLSANFAKISSDLTWCVGHKFSKTIR